MSALNSSEKAGDKARCPKIACIRPPDQVFSSYRFRFYGVLDQVGSHFETRHRLMRGPLDIEFYPCYNFRMKASEVRAFSERWEAVANIEQQELQSATVAQNWRRLNAIKASAARLRITRADDEGETEVFLRWASIKENYASN